MTEEQATFPFGMKHPAEPIARKLAYYMNGDEQQFESFMEEAKILLIQSATIQTEMRGATQ